MSDYYSEVFTAPTSLLALASYLGIFPKRKELRVAIQKAAHHAKLYVHQGFWSVVLNTALMVLFLALYHE